MLTPNCVPSVDVTEAVIGPVPVSSSDVTEAVIGPVPVSSLSPFLPCPRFFLARFFLAWCLDLVVCPRQKPFRSKSQIYIARLVPEVTSVDLTGT